MIACYRARAELDEGIGNLSCQQGRFAFARSSTSPLLQPWRLRRCNEVIQISVREGFFFTGDLRGGNLFKQRDRRWKYRRADLAEVVGVDQIVGLLVSSASLSAIFER